MNRYRIFDVLESRWLHIGYDTGASARRAVAKMAKACGDPSRYRVVDQKRPLHERSPQGIAR